MFYSCLTSTEYVCLFRLLKTVLVRYTLTKGELYKLYFLYDSYKIIFRFKKRYTVGYRVLKIKKENNCIRKTRSLCHKY